MKRFLLAILCLAFLAGPARADEGMWLPSLIGSRIKDMQSKGFKLTAKDIYDINQASLKDAIVLFGGGCTGELVSGEGLLFTNHHCGYDQIQQHSTVEHDYLTNGFWAMNRAEELPNPGLNVRFLVRMEDVTDRVTAGTEGLGEEHKAAARKANIDRIIKDAIAGTHYEASVEAFYYGNQFFLFVNETYNDVRLVGAPPSSIGKFGGDTDNWMWPRHTGDFSIFRIYAGKDNKPAEYSKDNVPYKPKRFFPVSTKGVKPDDFTMIYGFPGSTQQYVHSAYVDYVLNHGNPIRIKLRTIRLDEINAASDNDPAVRIAYAAKAAYIANGWKKWQGESLGLKRLGTIDKKKEYERRFTQWAANNPEYKGIAEEFENLYADMLPYSIVMDYFNEAVAAVELFTAANILMQIPDSHTGGMPPYLESFYKDYYPELDKRISVKLLEEYADAVPAEYIPRLFTEEIARHGSVEKYIDWVYANSILADRGKTAELFDDRAKLSHARNNDPAILLYGTFRQIFGQKIAGNYSQLNNRITGLYTTYVKGLMEFEPNRDFFPDANLTLRVAYGAVGGYTPEDAMRALPVSTIEGIMQKDNPNIYDYDVPQSLRNIYASKDYGRWAVDGTVPVCFLANNHTTGGNSGSPVINGNGELVGINFDRTWLSTMSDIEFDPEFCRNISVDIRYVLFVIDRIGGAGYLFDEMALDSLAATPKKGKGKN